VDVEAGEPEGARLRGGGRRVGLLAASAAATGSDGGSERDGPVGRGCSGGACGRAQSVAVVAGNCCRTRSAAATPRGTRCKTCPSLRANRGWRGRFRRQAALPRNDPCRYSHSNWVVIAGLRQTLLHADSSAAGVRASWFPRTGSIHRRSPTQNVIGFWCSSRTG